MKCFAEGLPRLGVLNVRVDLCDAITSPGPSVIISTTHGSDEIQIRYGDEVVTFRVPLRVSSTTSFSVSTDLRSSITSRISAIPSSEFREPTLVSADEVQTMWSNGATISCSCGKILVSNHELRWKDLPSSSWLEFSDYWHCHSGHFHSHSHETSHSAKQIPAVLKASPATALVGPTFLLFHPHDTQNVTIKVLFHLSPNWTQRGRLCGPHKESLIQKS